MTVEEKIKIAKSFIQSPYCYVSKEDKERAMVCSDLKELEAIIKKDKDICQICIHMQKGFCKWDCENDSHFRFEYRKWANGEKNRVIIT